MKNPVNIIDSNNQIVVSCSKCGYNGVKKRFRMPLGEEQGKMGVGGDSDHFVDPYVVDSYKDGLKYIAPEGFCLECKSELTLEGAKFTNYSEV